MTSNLPFNPFRPRQDKYTRHKTKGWCSICGTLTRRYNTRTGKYICHRHKYTDGKSATKITTRSAKKA